MRAILDVLIIALNLYKLDHHRRGGHVVADRLQRGQRPQRGRPFGLERAGGDATAAGFAADPPRPA